MQHTLESHKYFSAFAWILILGFSLFTYKLTADLKAEQSQISLRTEAILQTLEINTNL